MLFHTLYEGDHSDIWEPFQIVRLEQIVSTSRDMYIRVRKMYRPHDTHWTHEEGGKNQATDSSLLVRWDPQDVSQGGCQCNR